MRVTAFIYESNTCRVLHTGDWVGVESKALRMLRALRQHENKDAARRLMFCRMWRTKGLSQEQRSNPEALKAWFADPNQREHWSSCALADLNPYSLSIAPIPNGPYCYTFRRVTHDPKGMPVCHIKPCPYIKTRTFGGVPVTWCSFLRIGSVPNRTTSKQYALLRRHFGGKKAMDRALPSFLLWDSCKECGIKDNDS